MKSKSKSSVTIGICAFKSEKLIQGLLDSIIAQKNSNFKLDQILVHCDNSGDKTASVIKKYILKKDSKKIINLKISQSRLGFAGSFQQIIKNSKSDVLIVLNDDIFINQNNFVEKIVDSVASNPKIGLSCVNIKPLPARSFVEKSVLISKEAYIPLCLNKNHGNNIFTCDGKVLILSKKFYSNIDFPKDLSLLGNVDAYLYFLCKSKKLSYKFIHSAEIFCSHPKTLDEYLKWTSRNDSNELLLRKQFGKIIKNEFEKPASLWKEKFRVFLKSPVECLFIFGLSFYIDKLSRKQSSNFNIFWDTIESTKRAYK